LAQIVDDGAIDEWLRTLGGALSALSGFDGLWLHGSAATGDWVPGVSDVDLIAIWRSPLEGQRAALTTVVSSALRECPMRNADIHVVTRATASQPEREPHYELYGGIHQRDGGEPVLSGPSEDTNLLFDFESARANGVAIVTGPSPVEFGQVPLEWLLASADRELTEWDGYAYFRQPHMAALQSARAWMLAAEGTLSSKLSAGRWALERWSDPDVLRQAIARQRGDADSRVEEAAVRSLLAHARAVVRSRLGQAP
jgi:Domain of unknown function (DUF4111)/Nucleotidyltransferase domain